MQAESSFIVNGRSLIYGSEIIGSGYQADVYGTDDPELIVRMSKDIKVPIAQTPDFFKLQVGQSTREIQATTPEDYARLLDPRSNLHIYDPELTFVMRDVRGLLALRYAQAMNGGHPNLLKVNSNPVLIHSAMTPTENYFKIGAVYERLDGDNFEQYLESMSTAWPGIVRSTNDILSLLVPVAGAVDYLHSIKLPNNHAYETEKGIIHRDIKPGNILLDRKNSRLVLSDPGISYIGGNTNLHSEFTVGSPAYMSYEAMQGNTKHNYLSDQYSVGVLLARTVLGKLPPLRERAQNPLETVKAASQDEQMPQDEVVKIMVDRFGFDANVANHIRRAINFSMHMNPNMRYQNSQTLAGLVSQTFNEAVNGAFNGENINVTLFKLPFVATRVAADLRFGSYDKSIPNARQEFSKFTEEELAGLIRTLSGEEVAGHSQQVERLIQILKPPALVEMEASQRAVNTTSANDASSNGHSSPASDQENLPAFLRRRKR